jgi:hypothetical protein
MKRGLALAFCSLLAMTQAVQAAGFGNWAVVLVAGDDHAHDGSHALVFDNATRDLARAFAGIGFNPANMLRFSVDPVGDIRPSDIKDIATGLWDVSNRATDGCLVYFTSHGAYNNGILVGDAIMTPDQMSAMVNNACGQRPAVIVMSACYSGQFVPALQNDNRMIFTAARPDRTSFGCGNDLTYTFFDQCFLESIPQSADFTGLAAATTNCVAAREQKEGMTPPSEPQLSVGNKVAYLLRWK